MKEEDKTQEQEVGFGRILEESLNEIYVFDAETLRFIVVNAGARQNLGYSANELKELTPLDVKPEYTPASFEELIHPLRIGKQDKVQFETAHRRKDGSLYPVEVHLQLSTYRNSPAFVAIILDITARKQAENQQIEIAVQRDRIQFLENIISDLSHDLKTPLTSISTFLHLLQKQPDPEKQRSYVDKLEAQVHRLNRLFEDILTMARLDQSAEMTLAPINMAALADSITGRYGHITEQKNLALTIDLSADLPLVLGNESELRRAFANLIENAINYTSDGGSITVRIYAQDRNIAIEVHDTGIGIDEADLPQIFNRFYRTDRARSANQGGTGLGLAIVKRIIDLHGGVIEVESTLGKGSTFRIHLPTSG